MVCPFDISFFFASFTIVLNLLHNLEETFEGATRQHRDSKGSSSRKDLGQRGD